VISNLGVDITSLIAGIGIGGIAIALALQNILSDLFSSFSIYFDKPFKVGDFIVVGEHMGSVEKIGIKTTRVRSPQGEEIVIANQELTTARVQNFRRLERRRNLVTLGVTYETPLAKLKKVTGIIEDIINKQKDATFDRVHFQSFGDFSLNYQIVYYVESEEYGVFMDVQQAINFAIMEAFEKEGIEFAYPTQTLYLSKKAE
jgi:small-conductance mechanosensitive channel